MVVSETPVLLALLNSKLSRACCASKESERVYLKYLLVHTALERVSVTDQTELGARFVARVSIIRKPPRAATNPSGVSQQKSRGRNIHKPAVKHGPDFNITGILVRGDMPVVAVGGHT